MAFPNLDKCPSGPPKTSIFSSDTSKFFHTSKRNSSLKQKQDLNTPINDKKSSIKNFQIPEFSVKPNEYTKTSLDRPSPHDRAKKKQFLHQNSLGSPVSTHPQNGMLLEDSLDRIKQVSVRESNENLASDTDDVFVKYYKQLKSANKTFSTFRGPPVHPQKYLKNDKVMLQQQQQQQLQQQQQAQQQQQNGNTEFSKYNRILKQDSRTTKKINNNISSSSSNRSNHRCNDNEEDRREMSEYTPLSFDTNYVKVSPPKLTRRQKKSAGSESDTSKDSNGNGKRQLNKSKVDSPGESFKKFTAAINDGDEDDDDDEDDDEATFSDRPRSSSSDPDGGNASSARNSDVFSEAICPKTSLTPTASASFKAETPTIKSSLAFSDLYTLPPPPPIPSSSSSSLSPNESISKQHSPGNDDDEEFPPPPYLPQEPGSDYISLENAEKRALLSQSSSDESPQSTGERSKYLATSTMKCGSSSPPQQATTPIVGTVLPTQVVSKSNQEKEKVSEAPIGSQKVEDDSVVEFKFTVRLEGNKMNPMLTVEKQQSQQQQQQSQQQQPQQQQTQQQQQLQQPQKHQQQKQHYPPVTPQMLQNFDKPYQLREHQAYDSPKRILNKDNASLNSTMISNICQAVNSMSKEKLIKNSKVAISDSKTQAITSNTSPDSNTISGKSFLNSVYGIANLENNRSYKTDATKNNKDDKKSATIISNKPQLTRKTSYGNEEKHEVDNFDSIRSLQKADKKQTLADFVSSKITTVAVVHRSADDILAGEKEIISSDANYSLDRNIPKAKSNNNNNNNTAINNNNNNNGYEPINDPRNKTMLACNKFARQNNSLKAEISANNIDLSDKTHMNWDDLMEEAKTFGIPLNRPLHTTLAATTCTTTATGCQKQGNKILDNNGEKSKIIDNSNADCKARPVSTDSAVGTSVSSNASVSALTLPKHGAPTLASHKAALHQQQLSQQQQQHSTKMTTITTTNENEKCCCCCCTGCCGYEKQKFQHGNSKANSHNITYCSCRLGDNKNKQKSTRQQQQILQQHQLLNKKPSQQCCCQQATQTKIEKKFSFLKDRLKFSNFFCKRFCGKTVEKQQSTIVNNSLLLSQHQPSQQHQQLHYHASSKSDCGRSCNHHRVHNLATNNNNNITTPNTRNSIIHNSNNHGNNRHNSIDFIEIEPIMSDSALIPNNHIALSSSRTSGNRTQQHLNNFSRPTHLTSSPSIERCCGVKSADHVTTNPSVGVGGDGNPSGQFVFGIYIAHIIFKIYSDIYIAHILFKIYSVCMQLCVKHSFFIPLNAKLEIPFCGITGIRHGNVKYS
ncbi:hypothetical protein HELRODRAFT_177390 [Helobdella robusta]|uniref:Uncharacterized protein n=1 Tax=Helobdella robusta TaxID=6412 RepID=T1FBL7_HELRO|nr:hypothetical protein HELRODRAFT_177390 [Helobdella robusta]ESN98147.1 hypothetical protein HELRODRAFT_177390 [Helobdella robusta]